MRTGRRSLHTPCAATRLSLSDGWRTAYRSCAPCAAARLSLSDGWRTAYRSCAPCAAARLSLSDVWRTACRSRGLPCIVVFTETFFLW
ncbi:hypothetical protein HanIR_Chr14g0677321 [Helianthus annuus]|nr:hypothetical protein HanIR_Chr14g0677321 [Helianthus annuus]